MVLQSNDPSEPVPDSHVRFRAAVIVSVILWLAHLAPLLFPQARLWGVNHLLFLPKAYTLIYAGFGILALSAFIPAVAGRLSRVMETAGTALFDSPQYWKWMVAGLASLPVFWLLRMPTNLLGDGYTVINNVAGDLPVIVKWSEMGAIAVTYWVSRLLPLEGLARGEYAFAIVSVISGAVTMMVFCGLAYELGRDSRERLWIWCLLVCSGWMLLFFGYAENYPILWPFVTGYLYFGLRYLMGKGGIIIPAFLLLAALGLHLQMAFFAGSFLVLVFGRGAGGEIYHRHKKRIGVILAAVGIAAAAVFVILYHTSLSFRIHFLPPLTGRPGTPGYAVFSLAHLADIANELILLVPLLPMLIVMGWSRLRTVSNHPAGVFLAAFAAGGIILLSIFDPRLGMGRDWDLFALCGLGVALALAWSGAGASAAVRNLYPGLVATALLTVLPFFAANLKYQPSIDYMRSLLALDHAKSAPGMIILRDFYYNHGEYQRGDSVDQAIWDEHPSTRLGMQALDLITAGQPNEARLLADSMFTLDPYARTNYTVRGSVYMAMGRYDSAIADLETAIRLGSDDSRTFVKLAQAYYATRQFDQMMVYLRRGQKLNPDGVYVLQAVAMGFLAQEKYDSAYAYGIRLIGVDSTVPNGYLAAGVAQFYLGDRDEAKALLSRFIKLGGPSIDLQRAKTILEQIDRENK